MGTISWTYTLGSGGTLTIVTSDTVASFSDNGTTQQGYAVQSLSGTVAGVEYSFNAQNDSAVWTDQYDWTYHNFITADGTGDFGIDSHGLSLVDNGAGDSWVLQGDDGLDLKNLASGDGMGWGDITVSNEQAACFAAGALIDVPGGSVPVETLRPGDLVLTASGAARAVRWIGAGSVDLRARPRDERPVILRAGALAPGLPRRDLVLSPGHALVFDDGLAQAGRLVNGATILRDETRDEITYWHFELDSHDVVRAEGVEVETYRDDDNRRFLTRHWGEPLDTPAAPLAPTIAPGPRLDALRDWIWLRAVQRGARLLEDPGVVLEADGLPLTPASVADDRYLYRPPAGTRALRLVSRSCIPAETPGGNRDHRRLGLCVRDLVIDGAPVGLDDPRLADGWHAPERDGARGWRWTDGGAAMPVGGEIAFMAKGLATTAPVPEWRPAGVETLDDAGRSPPRLRVVR